MSKPTPGPWVATHGYRPTVKAGDTLIAVPGAQVDELGGRRLDELSANARLIAAAPELLALVVELSCLKLGKGGYCSMPLRELVERASATIAKTEGVTT